MENNTDRSLKDELRQMILSQDLSLIEEKYRTMSVLRNGDGEPFTIALTNIVPMKSIKSMRARIAKYIIDEKEVLHDISRVASISASYLSHKPSGFELSYDDHGRITNDYFLYRCDKMKVKLWSAINLYPAD